jgi:hypothetical protein
MDEHVENSELLASRNLLQSFEEYHSYIEFTPDITEQAGRASHADASLFQPDKRITPPTDYPDGGVMERKGF